jgi:hypothetical protein
MSEPFVHANWCLPVERRSKCGDGRTLTVNRSPGSIRPPSGGYGRRPLSENIRQGLHGGQTAPIVSIN